MVNLHDKPHKNTTMITHARHLAFALVFVLGCCFAHGAGGFTLSPDWHQTELLQELELRGKLPILKSMYPYSVSDADAAYADDSTAFWCNNMRRICSIFETRERGIGFLWTPGVWGKAGEGISSKNYGKMRFGMWGTYANWHIFGSYRLDSGYYDEPDYVGMRWERAAGKSDQTYALWKNDFAYFKLGKDYLGFGRGMALSGAKPFERFAAGVKFGSHVGVDWSVGQLDEFWEQQTDGTRKIFNRYLAAHRGYVMFKHLEVGFSEYMLFGGEGRSIEMYYLLPLYIFHGEQLNHKWNDNTLWSIDAKFLLPPVRIAGEFIIDDLQIEDEYAGDREPPQFGYAVEASYGVTGERLFITPKLRYEMVRNRVFNQNIDFNRFVYENSPLGAQNGCDYDMLSLGTSITGKKWFGNAQIYHKRKGEGRVDDEWTEPWIDDPSWSENFPSGVVEKSLGFSLSAHANFLDWNYSKASGRFETGIFAKIENVENFEHNLGNKKNIWEIRLECEAQFWAKGFLQ